MKNGQILRNLRLEKGKTLQEIADLFGITRGAVGHWESGGLPDTSKLMKLARYYGVPVETILGATPKPPVTQGDNISPGPDLRGLLPVISWVQAGAWSETVDNFQAGDAEEWLPCPFRHGPRAFVLRVVGESMRDDTAPKSYRDGDFIAVDPDRAAEHGSMVVIRLDGQDRATFKQLLLEPDGKRMLKALNPGWPNRIFEIDGDATVCGVVIGKWVPE